MTTELRPSRHDGPDLLVRPPCGVADRNVDWSRLIIDPIAQLSELADLVARDLLSRDEFDLLKGRFVDRAVATSTDTRTAPLDRRAQAGDG